MWTRSHVGTSDDQGDLFFGRWDSGPIMGSKKASVHGQSTVVICHAGHPNLLPIQTSCTRMHAPKNELDDD